MPSPCSTCHVARRTVNSSDACRRAGIRPRSRSPGRRSSSRTARARARTRIPTGPVRASRAEHQGTGKDGTLGQLSGTLSVIDAAKLDSTQLVSLSARVARRERMEPPAVVPTDFRRSST